MMKRTAAGPGTLHSPRAERWISLHHKSRRPGGLFLALMPAAGQISTPQDVTAEHLSLIGLDVDCIVAASNRSQKLRVQVIPDYRRRRSGIDEHAIREQTTTLCQILCQTFWRHAQAGSGLRRCALPEPLPCTQVTVDCCGCSGFGCVVHRALDFPQFVGSIWGLGRLRVLVIYGHPLADSLAAALHRVIIETLRHAGHEVNDCDLYAEGFDPVLSASERRAITPQPLISVVLPSTWPGFAQPRRRCCAFPVDTRT
jgi:Flavodoxin-like fold